MIIIIPTFMGSLTTYDANTDCVNICEEKMYGCLDSTAVNYVDSANTALPCYYFPVCISPAYLEYHVDTTNGYYTDINIQDSCNTLAVFGCMDDTMYNYNSLDNVDNGGWVAYIYGGLDPLRGNYNPQATAGDPLIAQVYGCTYPTAYNDKQHATHENERCGRVDHGSTERT